MKTITVSAPGKLMLFGEHAVVYGRPCLVTAVDQRMRCSVELIDAQALQLEAPDVQITGYRKSLLELGEGEIPRGAKFVEIAVKNFSDMYGLKTGVKVTTKSEFSSLFGFGSSSASAVCIMKALSILFGKRLSQKAIFELSYKTILDIQGKGSGFDVAAAVYGGILFYTIGGKVQQVRVGSLPLIVGYSGIKADTVKLMNEVKKTANKYPQVVSGIYNEIETIVQLGKKSLKKQDWLSVGELMNVNQGYLAALGVSTKKLADMVYAARDAGAYGAKLSGAGGGDCMIALASDKRKKAVERAVQAVGGKIIQVTTNAQGARIE